jgi:hypothetical protein
MPHLWQVKVKTCFFGTTAPSIGRKGTTDFLNTAPSIGRQGTTCFSLKNSATYWT